MFFFLDVLRRPKIHFCHPWAHDQCAKTESHRHTRDTSQSNIRLQNRWNLDETGLMEGHSLNRYSLMQ